MATADSKMREVFFSVEDLKAVVSRFSAAAEKTLKQLLGVEDLPPSTLTYEQLCQAVVGGNSPALEAYHELFTEVGKIAADSLISFEKLQGTVASASVIADDLKTAERHVEATDTALLAVLYDVVDRCGGVTQVTAESLFEPLKEELALRGIPGNVTVERIEEWLSRDLVNTVEV